MLQGQRTSVIAAIPLQESVVARAKQRHLGDGRVLALPQKYARLVHSRHLHAHHRIS